MAYATLPLISRQLNTLWLAPLDSLLLYLIHRSLFLFRLSFPYFPFVIPVKTGIQSVISGSPIRSASLSVEDDKGAFGWGWQRMCHSRSLLLSFSRKWESSPNGSRIKCGMTGGAGSPIRSASLSVEDDKEGSWLRMTRGWNDILRKSCNYYFEI